MTKALRDAEFEALRKRAKRRLKELRAADAGAHAWLARWLPEHTPQPGLREVQQALAREQGQPSWAALKELYEARVLEQRGLLDETLVIWAGEFGRTVYSQGKLTADDYGRDHHPRCFTVWLAGGGVKPGITYGETDDYCYNVTRDPVHVHDLHATILHCLGIDHTQLTFKYQGRHFRLTDVHGVVKKELLA